MKRGGGGGGEISAERGATGDDELAGGGRGRDPFVSASVAGVGETQKQKPPFRLTEDDSKPLLRDPILRPDLIETEQAVLRLPPFSRGNGQI